MACFATFAPDAAQALRAISLEDPLIAVRKMREVFGAGVSLDGLEARLSADPAWGGRFARELLPGLRRAVVDFLEAGRPVPASMTPGAAARRALPRADSPGLLGLMLLGGLEADRPDAPFVDAWRLWASPHPQEQAKLQCLLETFRPGLGWDGDLVIERRVGAPRPSEMWSADTSPLMPMDVIEAGVIDDADGFLQADFANAFLGGGVLTGGCVQEEIRFAVCPELCLGLLVSPRMRDDEAIVLRGAARLATTRGYAYGLRHLGPHEPRPGESHPGVLAIDALRFDRGDPKAQWTSAACLRELGKLEAGLAPGDTPFATGNWGCGVFGGDPRLKALLQWLAASARGVPVRYYTFGDRRVAGLEAAVLRARARTVGELWSALVEALPYGGEGLLDRI